MPRTLLKRERLREALPIIRGLQAMLEARGCPKSVGNEPDRPSWLATVMHFGLWKIRVWETEGLFPQFSKDI